MIGETHLVGMAVAAPLVFGITLMLAAQRRGGLLDTEPMWVFIAASEAFLALLLGNQAHSDALVVGQTSTGVQLAASVLLALAGGAVVYGFIAFVEYRRTGAALEAMEGGQNGN